MQRRCNITRGATATSFLWRKYDVDIIHPIPTDSIKSPSLSSTHIPSHYELNFVKFPPKGIIGYCYIFITSKSKNTISVFYKFSVFKLYPGKIHV